ncbi:substrate-binding domain-containing protein [uncultured Desulfobulbus sp.]|uniref:PstS family phosphate ABC transporter substrate-binding protein n=1 Tax=uncultured Desulfobulbus sp. TaxID=239745 RepID=UPI0029C7EF45|nr:substrate-binding domain-containing protein [uncultured Desulfobulbus sp.]
MNKLIGFAMSLLISASFALASPCLAQPPPQPEKQVQLIAAGSGVNLGITRLLAEAYTAHNPQTLIDVPGSIGTRGAIKATAEGAISLGLISRPLKDEEKALGLVAQPYARTAIVIGAHPNVKDDSLSSQELIEIFKGIKTKWHDGNQIIVQAREKSDSGFLALENTLPGFKEAYAESHEAKRWTLYFNDQEANQALATVPFAIGVTDLGMIATERLPIKVLQLNGISPNPKNILNGTYPLIRQLSFIYRTDSLAPEAKAFLDFVASQAGREILQAQGYLPAQ